MGSQRSGPLNSSCCVPPREGCVSDLVGSSREGDTETTVEGHSVKAVAAVGALAPLRVRATQRTGCFFKILSWTSQNTSSRWNLNSDTLGILCVLGG
uniref:Uncharacterized protein n=1 Tax=Piliocolobus tephrosceles TaxID=591936 RepID=A0A8C9M0T3_9PRIM